MRVTCDTLMTFCTWYGLTWFYCISLCVKPVDRLTWSAWFLHMMVLRLKETFMSPSSWKTLMVKPLRVMLLYSLEGGHCLWQEVREATVGCDFPSGSSASGIIFRLVVKFSLVRCKHVIGDAVGIHFLLLFSIYELLLDPLVMDWDSLWGLRGKF